MNNNTILEKYKLFRITEDNQPSFGATNSYGVSKKYDKCTILKENNIVYHSSTDGLKKN